MLSEFIAAGLPWKMFNFIVFVGGLYLILRKPVREFWTTRSHGLRFEIEEAKRVHRETAERHEGIQKRLSRIEQEVRDLVRSLREEGEMEKLKVIEESQRLSEKMSQDCERIAAQEVRRAKETLKMQAVQLSIELANRILREKFTEADQKKMTGHYLSELERGAS